MHVQGGQNKSHPENICKTDVELALVKEQENCP